jgi:hypothetical protein
MVWHESTRKESAYIINKIPPLNWDIFAGLYRPEQEWKDDLSINSVTMMVDPEDRKFAALALDTGAVLVSNDDHILEWRGRIEGVEISRPGEAVETVSR